MISIDLDADAWTLTFQKNDSEMIGTFEIKRGEYRIAVTMSWDGDSVSFA